MEVRKKDLAGRQGVGCIKLGSRGGTGRRIQACVRCERFALYHHVSIRRPAWLPNVQHRLQCLPDHPQLASLPLVPCRFNTPGGHLERR